MAGETILVVDDSAVNLKLAAAVLRSDGYRVLLASSAEQALMTLRTTLPELVLVDVLLPGMNGLQLARCIREDARTRKLLIVVLTASTAQECEQQAYDAGCDGFIVKPIDTRTLGPRLRVFLEGAPPPAELARPAAPQGVPAELELAGPEIESLRRTFLIDGIRQVRRLLELPGSEMDAPAAARQFHQWVGSAGALGFPELAEQARAAAELLARPGWTTADLRQVLTNLSHAFSAPPEAAETTIPPAIAQELERKRIALVGFGDEEAERVCVALEKVRALPRLFLGDEPPDSESLRDCSIIMVHVRAETHNTPWLRPDFVAPRPLVLVGGRDHLLALPDAVQSRACEFLIDGWQPEEAVMRLSLALTRPSTQTALPNANPEIVIVDDDSNVQTVVRRTLENLGMVCRCAASGTAAFALISERCPNAAVLDINMPGMDGFEVLAGIRKAGLPVKVILLTARLNERDILRGFELGADDYVVKPFNPLELAARLKRLV